MEIKNLYKEKIIEVIGPEIGFLSYSSSFSPFKENLDFSRVSFIDDFILSTLHISHIFFVWSIGNSSHVNLII